MPQIIEVPNYGKVEFPDGMSDSDIVSAIKKTSMGYQPEQAKPQSMMDKYKFLRPELFKVADSVVEPLLTVGSGMLGHLAGTVAGVGAEIGSGQFGETQGTGSKAKYGDIGAQVGSQVRDALTWEPRSRAGQEVVSGLGTLLEKSKLAGLPVVGPELPAIAQSISQQTPRMKMSLESALASQAAKQTAKQDAAAVVTRNMMPKIETATKAVDEGYVLNPAKVNPTTGNLIRERVTGDSTFNNAAFEKNQVRADLGARKQLGLEDGVGLDDTLFNKIKEQATRPHREIEKIPSIATDQTFLDNIQGGSWLRGLSEEQQALFKSSPAVNKLIETASLPAYDGIAAIKYISKLREEAQKTFRSPAATGEASALASAQWSIARELEANIGRQLEVMHKADPSKGYADLAKRLKEGRQKYAEVSAIESATTNGNVDVLKLAKDKRGDSFTGELALMKQLGEAHPEVFKAHGTTLPETIRRYGIGGITGSVLGAPFGPHGIVAGGLAGGAADPIIAHFLKKKMVTPEFQRANVIPKDMRPMREQLGYAQNLGPRRIPINRDIPYRLPELNPAATTGPLPTVESIVIPSSWKEGMQPNATGKSAPIGIPDQLLPLSEQYPQGIPIGAAEGRMPVPSTPLPKLPPQERGLLSLEDPATVRVTGKRPQGGLLDFPLRQEVLQKLEPQITAFREEAARLEAIANNKYPITGKPQAEARMQLEQLQKEFAAGMRQLGIDKPQEAIGLQPLFQSGSTTKLPIVKSRGLLDYSKE